MRSLYAHYIKRLINDNHAIQMKYIQWYWRLVLPVNWETQVIEYAPNEKIPPAIQYFLITPHAQPTRVDISNDTTIASKNTHSTSQPQASNAR